LLASVAAAGPFSSVFVFGDSLSDTGNLAEFQGANFPNPSFFNDSVTNGPPGRFRFWRSISVSPSGPRYSLSASRTRTTCSAPASSSAPTMPSPARGRSIPARPTSPIR